MKPRTFELSATQTALLAGLGSCMLSASFFLVIYVGAEFRGHPTGLIPLLPAILLAAIGVGISVTWEARFKRGLANNRWDHDEIQRLREFFDSWSWKAFSFALIVSAGAVMLVNIHRDVTPAMGVLVLSMAASRFTWAVRRPRNPSRS
jgi:formate/nitrite transporter FocA (FNT family)